jgi:hypothetical protein
MAAVKKDNIFYAEAVKGYTFKVTIDSLAIAMQRTIFNVTKTGFFCRAADEAEQILYDIDFPRENFRPYICAQNMSFSLNLKHLQKMVRNVKKKDSIVIFIEKSMPDRLYVAIKPAALNSGHNSRVETLFVTIARIDTEDFGLGLPEVYVNEKGTEINVYGYPKTIDASDFQKMKKMTTLGKLVKIRMQTENYISFCSDNGKLYGSHLEFGEINSEYQNDDEEEENREEGEIKGMYEAEFHMSIFSLLMKLPGLCKLMNFYAPRVQRYPLKIQMNAENLGKITIYIKDALQIAYEQTEKERKEREKIQKSEEIMSKTLSKKKK